VSRVSERGCGDQVLEDSQKLSAFDLGKSAVGEKQSSIHHGKA
jgi:hypothetical protein